ncbi:MAG TPA: tRNA 2-selenouridine(34) synthase MnmH [Spirochaetota bacterium]|nr:tRNA 2-selenouridine(34) synthase MnmH [Spirochaetota bacterium]HQO39608.1 tRNA 2-selenouridine(34) synthase MnmH [Spirochaetota bacterium]
MCEITYGESLKLDNPLYIDVRTPAEYCEDHIPGAVNYPIFDNEERKEIGTLYKMVSRDDAVRRGTEIGGKRIGAIIESIMSYRERDIVLYCARGGMRSGAVASLVNSLGVKAWRLKDGYRAYRSFVSGYLDSVEIRPQLFVLQGLTGAGKTEILGFIENSIDLEGMAGHRSSLFGGIGLEQQSQKSFETQLAVRLNELGEKSYTVIEGESKKIGNLHIPENIFRQMRNAPVIYIDTPIERRVAIIKKEYARFNDHERVMEIVLSLTKRLGQKKTDDLAGLYKSGRIDEFIEMLLVEYYDNLYRYTLDRFNYAAVIRNMESESAAAEVLNAVAVYLKK